MKPQTDGIPKPTRPSMATDKAGHRPKRRGARAPPKKWKIFIDQKAALAAHRSRKKVRSDAAASGPAPAVRDGRSRKIDGFIF